MASRTVPVNLDSWFADVLGNAGNGKGDRMCVGNGASGGSWDWRNRFAIRIPRGSLFDGITNASQISAFNIRLKASDDVIGIGSAVKFWMERATEGFAENTESRRTFVSTDGGAGAKWPGPSRTTTNRVKWEGTPDNGTWITISMLALGREWFNNPAWTNLHIVGLAADTSTGYDESSPNRRCTFITSEAENTGNRPYAELVFNTNNAPNAPTDVAPTDSALAPSASGTSLAMTGRYTDPDGDTATEDLFEVYPDSSTDAALGTRLTSVYTVAATAHNALRTRTATGLPARTFVKWRARFKDKLVWGPFTPLQRAKTAYQPSSSNPSVTPATLTPDFFASLVSQDAGDFITAVSVFVYQDPATGSTITKWASGKITVGGSSNRMQLAYGGSPLVYGTQYRWQYQLWNRDDVPTPLSGNLFFTQRESLGPTIVPGDTQTKINTRTPTFTLTDPGGGNIDQHRMRFYSPTGALLADTGVVSSASSASKNVVTPANIWDWGQDPMVDAAIRVTGNADLGPFSEKVTVHLNAIPGAPYPLSVTTAGAVLRPLDEVWVVDAATPTLAIPFRDFDRDLGYIEAPSRREVEIRTLDDVHIAGSPFVATTGITDSYTTPTLTNETTYKIRARYDDNANVRSEWSDYLFVKRSAAPTLTNVTPNDAVPITDPTPTIAWTFNSAGGKAQARYRVVVSLDGSQIYDSGSRLGADASFRLPAGVLPDDSTPTWTLQVWDTDELSASVTRTFTTDFTQPPALTGLTVTVDTEAKALVLAWDESALPAEEFEAYLVYAKGPDSPFVLVATITDKLTPTYTYRGAEHNTEVQVRVTQTNGWMESEPVEASGQIDVTGYWWLRPDPIELRYVAPGAFQVRPDITLEDHKPTAGGRITLTWGDHGDVWSLRLEVPDEDRWMIPSLRRDMASGTAGILKTPRGRSIYSTISDLSLTHQRVGFTDVAISGSEVARTAAEF